MPDDSDCQDTSALYHPGAEEADCADPNDYNCDGSVGFEDADSDGFAACQECDDADPDVNPDAAEVCDGIDDDCDGTIDQDAVDAETWYADFDGDGYSDLESAVADCEPPAGFQEATDDDCDDGDIAVHPGADDIPDDGVDQDCSGSDETSWDPVTSSYAGGGGVSCASGAPGSAWLWVVGLGLAARRRARSA